MAVIPETQLQLVRQRRELQRAFDRRDWVRVKAMDTELLNALSIADDDSNKDPATLLNELRQVVGLYRSIVDECGQSLHDLGERFVTHNH